MEDVKTVGTTKRSAISAIRVQEIARLIEADIESGRYVPGAWLKQVDLEEAYGCTRLHVRQALDRLAEKSVVTLIPNRGYRVTEFDAERYSQLLHVRAILEVAALQEVAQHITADSLAELKRLADRFVAIVEEGSIIELEESNRAYHSEMLRHCPNKELVNLIFNLRSSIPVAVSRRKNTLALCRKAAQEHIEMIELLRARDVEGACALMRHHVLAGIEFVD
ncbi:conserved hypothetical protein [Paraburkholderia piptadeniae]|uniref:HTH gntR-type domain-containing protein n=1 Tax=Paraburkholderia piptadeniae TaxID=1701573 RepID=A0A1N7SPN5_9BURK|nr:GntR family transcriptional regulator [Paraburkholderia piptadeniae]SIT49383.1 conserved hypothetical protein [Paraburkholderia piptadeniae]